MRTENGWSLPIPVEYMPVVLQKVQEVEDTIQQLTGIVAKVQISLQPTELNDMVLQTMICNVFDVSWADIKGKSRKGPIVQARHTYFFLSRYAIGKGPSQIAREFNSDHTTILHGCTSVQNRMDTNDVDFLEKFNLVHKAFFHEAEA